ncbi:serine/threonine protein kinase [Novipirellula artificiosorum]|uniref:Serine/threonine-protein kinase PknB n=1 Tax=Novipirellula artificiosorum TaxID=2528016 RepID=A0A5C6D5U2_9BACT|nr:serine/threonine-protein kinase [Novipirellula artificiosorum]TWU32198.1 Serine/threonine-protein kinase PknB [Novipirellula artificiosorum]
MPNPTERAIFLQALDEDNLDERLAYLDSACGDDASLRGSVEALLAAHERPAALLDHPICGDRSRFAFSSELSEGPLEHIGMQIGPYKLMEQIGEGGFGLVFVAEQEQPVRRRVALKIVKPGAASKEVIARFEGERQAVAMMNHPNIAQVFDAGVTTDHRPFFVMELVRGLPITEFCDKKQLDLRERLNLIIDVCSAVHHAHQKGVIHRDIKPSNVMVTLHDGKPVAKVIDFGVAKAIGQRLTDKTVYTRFHSMIGTPLYMSPEQAEMSGLDIDTRSDIYSLGVLLYELLAGTTPFDRNRLDSAGLDELRRIIREEEPPRPSTRLSTLNKTLSTIADQRRIDPGRLTSTLRGDLDWIVMKSLEKDRSRRYDSAASLADDIRRFLDGDPITARPPSTAYQFQKFARRHRVVIITAALVGCSMIVGTAASLWQMSKAIAAKQEVEQFAANLTQASVLVASGQTHADAGRWSEAARDYGAAVAIQPTFFLPRVQRGQLYARIYLLPEAARDYAFALDTGASTSQPQWWGVPALFLYTGHDDAFARLSKQYQQHLLQDPDEPKWLTLRGLVVSDQNNESMDRQALAELARSWLSLPPPGPPPGLDELLGFDELLGLDGPPGFGRPPGPESNGPPGWREGPPPDRLDGGRPRESLPRNMCQYVSALAELRDKNFDSALNLLREADADPRWPDRYLVQAPLALAYHYSGKSEQAKRALDLSGELIRDVLNVLREHPQENGSTLWSDLVEALQIHDEASQAIVGIPSPLRPNVDQVRGASLNLIARPMNSQSE